MIVTRNSRGFPSVEHELYTPDKRGDTRLITQSTMIGDYEDALENPGSSYLWIGSNWHLNRAQVAELIDHLQLWLDTGRFVGQDEAGFPETKCDENGFILF